MLVALAIAAAFLLLPTPWGIAVVVFAAAFEVFELALWRRLLRYRVRTGAEALVGMSAEVVEECAPGGRVRLRGELWNARSSEPAAVGETVVVRGVDGLRLDVAPASAAPEATEKGP
jgi:membrane-bound serine protease (ClpP class)